MSATSARVRTEGRRQSAAAKAVAGCIWLLIIAGAFAREAHAQTGASQPPVMSLSTTDVTRGSSFRITMTVAPKDLNSAQILVDDQPLCTHFISGTPGTSATFEATIPAFSGRPIQEGTGPCPVGAGQGTGSVAAGEAGPTAAVSPQRGVTFISLGQHHISVQADRARTQSDVVLTVSREGPRKPILTAISPSIVTFGRAQRLVLSGSNFIVSPPDDNTILVGNVPQDIIWDGCKAGTPQSGMNGGHKPHGEVISTDEIVLCDVPFLAAGDASDIVVQQGDRTSNPLTVHIQSYSTARILWWTFIVLLIAIVLVLALASRVRKYTIDDTRYGFFRILFLDPETNTYSLSKYQFYMWSAAAIFSYSYYALSRLYIQHQLLPDIPGNLPAIVAIGAGTAIGSQVVTTIRGPKGGGQEFPTIGDFVTSGGVAAPDRIQMFVWTTLGAMGFCIATLHWAPWQIIQLPDMGQGWMYMMGLSSIGYLGGKLARLPGPVLNEISITPGSPDGIVPVSPTTPFSGPALGDGPQAATTGPIAAPPVANLSGAALGVADMTQPIASAQQALRSAQAAVAPIAAATAPAAFNATQDALKALRSALDCATKPGPDLLDRLSDAVAAADAASQLAAVEFGRLLQSDADTTSVEAARTLAEQAQQCAAATQDLGTGASRVVGAAQERHSIAASEPPPPGVRNIELRGQNLSVDATFEINDRELPFRMLIPENGVRAPIKVVPDDQPGMAKILRLRISEPTMVQADRQTYLNWFGTPGKQLKFAINNPDGQRAELTVSLPPGTGQSHT